MGVNKAIYVLSLLRHTGGHELGHSGSGVCVESCIVVKSMGSGSQLTGSEILTPLLNSCVTLDYSYLTSPIITSILSLK